MSARMECGMPLGSGFCKPAILLPTLGMRCCSIFKELSRDTAPTSLNRAPAPVGKIH